MNGLLKRLAKNVPARLREFRMERRLQAAANRWGHPHSLPPEGGVPIERSDARIFSDCGRPRPQQATNCRGGRTSLPCRAFHVSAPGDWRTPKAACLRGGTTALLAICLLAGCAVGPDYQRPPAGAPAGFRGETQPTTNSLADLPWQEVFKDGTLQGLIAAALTNNYDLRIAVTRVEQARAIADQAKSGYFPQINYAAIAGAGKNIGSGNTPSPTGTSGSAFAGDVNAAWDVDLWGRIRRLNESARAQYFASVEARRDVTAGLVAEVAQDYFQLLALQRELDIARDTTNSYGESLKIFSERLQGGVASKLETSSAEGLLTTAAATIPTIEQQIVAQENQISVLLAQNPGAIARGSLLLDGQSPPDVPAGLPSTLLERRPDIR